ncbi:hypothetical protein MKX03_000401, partial [Papaver bracteatum]
MDIHTERHSEPSLSYASFEKSEHDSDGQEPANSMMTLLLPQVLPLLKKTPRNKQPAPHNSGIYLVIKEPSLEFSAEKSAGKPVHCNMPVNEQVERDSSLQSSLVNSDGEHNATSVDVGTLVIPDFT